MSAFPRGRWTPKPLDDHADQRAILAVKPLLELIANVQQRFEWSSRNRPSGEGWIVSYYARGMGFETGLKVYYGRNEWPTEQAAIESQVQWEKRIGGAK